MWRRALIGMGLVACLACAPGGAERDDPPTTPTVTSSSAAAPTTEPATVPSSTIPPPTSTTQPEPRTLEILVFHKTAGFAHESIGAGIEAFHHLGEEQSWKVTATDDAAVFSDTGLEPFRVIVFLNTTGDVLDESQEAAMERFVGDGGGYVGIHSAADTEYEWPWYGGLIGAYFTDHPAPQQASVAVQAPDHPVAAGLPARLERFDEWYNFRRLPEAEIIATLDEESYDGGTMGDPHPIIWAHEYDGGRSVYTGFGHTSESFSESEVLDHLVAAIRWAAGDGAGS
ncbi:MAG TPA: ThuA domain-containing protein [Acidimicrobiia bacterium]|nr:ThuA domain-containing protein [Acidimicrobiia bacterium]